VVYQIQKTEVTKVTYDAPVDPKVRYRTTLMENRVISPRVSGGFTTFPDGSRFRLPTNWQRCTSKLIPGSAQITSAKWNQYMLKTETSAGGYRPDLFVATSPQSPTGCQVGFYSPPEIPAAMRNEAATKALLKLADQKVNLAENLATAGQTARMLAGAAHSLSDLLMSAYRDRSLRPYLLRSLRSISKEGVPEWISNKYLEFIYGWKPLMNDVYSLVQLSKGHQLRGLLLNAQGDSRRDGDVPPIEFFDGSENNTFKMVSGSERATVRTNIWARVDPDWQGLRSLNQLGLLNPLSLAWELTPWSFVVDWLLPIGSVLSALTAPAGLIFISGTTSVRTKCSYQYEVSCWQGVYSTPSSHKPGTGTLSVDGYSRTVLGGWPIPGLWVDPDPLRGDRIFKAAALAISNLSGVRKSTIG